VVVTNLLGCAYVPKFKGANLKLISCNFTGLLQAQGTHAGRIAPAGKENQGKRYRESV